MALVTFDIEELQSLIGKARPISEIEEAFNAIGTPVEKVDDRSISIDITPDRSDMMSVEGAARAVSFFLGLSDPKPYTIEDSKINLDVDNIPIRPYIVAAIAKGVNIDERFIKSMIQAQEKIHETFGRKRKKVAIGIHDFDKTYPPFSYKTFKYITFVPLDFEKEMNPQQILSEHPKGKEYNWIYANVNEYPFVLDSKGVISFPPIINAERTRVTHETKNLFIEVTGTSERAIRDTLHIFLTALYDRGAKIENITLRFLNRPAEKSAKFDRKEKLDVNFVNKVLGTKFKPEEIVQYLKKMGYISRIENNSLLVFIPPYRADIMHQVDLVEDVAIGYGYQNFKPKLPAFSTIGKELPTIKKEERIRMALVGLGFQEVCTWYLTNKEKEQLAICEETEAAEIKNPRTTDFTRFRTAIFPSLLAVLALNKTKKMPQKIFEIGKVADQKGNCKTKLCCVITDIKTTFSDIKGIYETLNDYLHTSYREEDFKWLISGRSIAILTQKKKEKIGWCGEIHPKVLENFQLEYPVGAFELFI